MVLWFTPPQSASELQFEQLLFGDYLLQYPDKTGALQFLSRSFQQNYVFPTVPLQLDSSLHFIHLFKGDSLLQYPANYLHLKSSVAQQYEVFPDTPPQSSSTIHLVQLFFGDNVLQKLVLLAHNCY